MKVQLVAHTKLSPGGLDDTGYTDQRDASDPDTLAEFAGRACYQSWHRPRPETATNEGYLSNIIGQGHESVLEHASASFYVTGVSRSLTHELIRHRHLSFSELSQRFVNVEHALTVFPPGFAASGDDLGADVEAVMDVASYKYNEIVDNLGLAGLPRKQAREAARAVMPNATETRIVVTGSMRAWRDVIRRRYHVAADAEIREFAEQVLSILRDVAPNSFQDLPTEPFGG